MSTKKTKAIFETTKKTKIVATIGPATESEAMLEKLFRAGVNVMRLNFSHGSHEEHQHRVTRGRKVSERIGKPVAILQDLSGPKIRIGDFYQERVTLEAGSEFTLTTEKIVGDEKRAYVNYPTLHEELKPGSFVLLDDGKKKLRVEEIKGKEIRCTVLVGGDTKGRRGVNLPGAYLKTSSITAKDKEDLKFGIKNKVDFIALSFVRRAEDVLELRGMLDRAKSKALIISKIETQEAVDNFDSILEATDGVMVARGDLAIEIPAEDVPIVQKNIIKKCNMAGKPVITATQMLESMIKSPVPTRAEVSDIANAILDGTDAIMLSEETTLGENPVEAIDIMHRVASRIESDFLHKQLLSVRHREHEPKTVVDAVSSSVIRAADAVEARYIAALTTSGGTARMISRHRPSQTIFAFTSNRDAYQGVVLSFGCIPVNTNKFVHFDDALGGVRKFFLDNKLAKKGDRIIVTASVPFGKIQETNMMSVLVL